MSAQSSPDPQDLNTVLKDHAAAMTSLHDELRDHAATLDQPKAANLLTIVDQHETAYNAF